MSNQPETRYARSRGYDVAYQVLGDGPKDLIIVPGFISNVDSQWIDPAHARGLRRLASFSRLITFDKLGTGLSDPVQAVPTLEERMEDVHAVLDAAGSERATLMGISEGGPMSILFAATYPDRVSGLVLYGTLADGRRDPEERPWWEESWRAVIDAVDHWGEGRLWSLLAPNHAQNELIRRTAGAFERSCASPAMARALVDAVGEMTVRDVAPAVSVPTLILHRRGDRMVPIGHGRELAGLMPHARYVELPGEAHLWHLENADQVIGEVERFLTGARGAEPAERMLATVLFTDVVGSTQRAAVMGDSAWRELIERQDALTRWEVEGLGGRVVKSMGDGHLAVFAAPGRAIEAARQVVDGSRELGLEVRAGVHTGECETLGQDLSGMAVNIGARVGALAGPGEVLVSGTVKDLVVGSQLQFAERGARELKGVPGEWRLYAVADDAAAPAGARLAERAPMRMTDRALLAFARRTPRLSSRLMRGSLRAGA